MGDVPIVHSGDSFDTSPFRPEHTPPYTTFLLDPELQQRVTNLEQRVEDLTTLLAAVYEKYMDKPIDLDA